MPLERRVQPALNNHRNCRATRCRSYRLSSTLPASRREGVTLGLSTSRDASGRESFEELAKRSRHGTCVCTTYDESLQTNNIRSNTLLGDEADETQRLPSEQRPQTNAYQGSQPPLNSTLLRSDSMNTSSSRGFSGNPDSLDRIPPNESTPSSATTVISELSMIPNVVPMSTSSELSHSVASSVTNFNCSPTDIVQRARKPACERQESYNANQPDLLINHERSFEDWSTSSIEYVDTSCSSASFRSCRRSMSAMPPPSTHARRIAIRVIRHACARKTPNEHFLWCPDCKHLPVLPVTGQCGHTRCTKCIQENGVCPCGTQAPNNLHVNTLIQSLIRKMLPEEPSRRNLRVGDEEQAQCDRKPLQMSLPVRMRAFWRNGVRKSGGQVKRLVGASCPVVPPHILMSTKARFVLAQRLLSCGKHGDAAPHLARVAASPNPFARTAHYLLAQSITVLSGGVGMSAQRVSRALHRAVQLQSAGSWLHARDLECVLCYHTYTRPVTTPCGHTYCRTCIERSMDYKKSCALCLRTLHHFDLAATRDTEFVCAALKSIDALSPPQPPEPDVIPIFVCTVAYPAIPCPLFTFDPRYWLMIRRVLESGSRKFGMVTFERDRSYSDYGTILEVCDCVHFEDGRSILSTVGVSRFRVIERDVRDGCDVARIQPLTDITPTDELVIWELRIMAVQISYKALVWLNGMSSTVRSEIETAFGRLLCFIHQQDNWWDSPDGPAWLWWLVAILPLRSEIKILILSTNNLLKRMMAVSRTLEAIDQVAISTMMTTECDLSNEEWLERGA